MHMCYQLDVCHGEQKNLNIEMIHLGSIRFVKGIVYIYICHCVAIARFTCNIVQFIKVLFCFVSLAFYSTHS